MTKAATKDHAVRSQVYGYPIIPRITINQLIGQIRPVRDSQQFRANGWKSPLTRLWLKRLTLILRQRHLLFFNQRQTLNSLKMLYIASRQF